MPFRAVLYLAVGLSSSRAAACGLADLALVAPWCSYTVSPMHLPRGAAGGIGSDLAWRLALLLRLTPLFSEIAWRIIPARVLLTHTSPFPSRPMPIRWCRRTTLAMRAPRAAVARDGTDHVWRRDLVWAVGGCVTALPVRTAVNVGSALRALGASMLLWRERKVLRFSVPPSPMPQPLALSSPFAHNSSPTFGVRAYFAAVAYNTVAKEPITTRGDSSNAGPLAA